MWPMDSPLNGVAAGFALITSFSSLFQSSTVLHKERIVDLRCNMSLYMSLYIYPPLRLFHCAASARNSDRN